jgi:hypothetical protein
MGRVEKGSLLAVRIATSPTQARKLMRLKVRILANIMTIIAETATKAAVHVP